MDLVTDDQMAFTHEQIHIDRIGEDIQVFVVDYKQSCKHLQAFPKMWRTASADLLGRGKDSMPSTTFLKKHRIESNSSALDTLLCRPLPPNDANYYTNHAGTMYICWITLYPALVQQCSLSNYQKPSKERYAHILEAKWVRGR